MIKRKKKSSARTEAETIQFCCNLYTIYNHRKERDNDFFAEIDISKNSFNHYMKIKNRDPNVTISCPQEGTLEGVVDFFNARFTPQINVDILLHDNLDAMFKSNYFPIAHKTEEKGNLDWYIGAYYCYCFDKDDDKPDTLNYGCALIYKVKKTYKAELVLGFKSFEKLNSMFDLVEIEKKINVRGEIFPGITNDVRDHVKKNVNGLDFIFYKGDVEILDQSLVLNLYPDHNDKYRKTINIVRHDKYSSLAKYACGICPMLTSKHSIGNPSFQYIAFIRSKFGDKKDFSKDIGNYLAINYGKKEYINVGENDQAFFNYVTE